MSFVVIAHNEAAVIERAMHSILAQDGLDRPEVIVVDDGSTDGTGHLVAGLAARHPGVRLHRLEQNRGRGFARDTGIRLAGGEVIATVDADVVLPPDWSSRCLAELAFADAVGGTAVPDGDVAYLSRRFALEARIVAHTTNATGSNAAYRRELFERISFDRDLREGEDVAFNHSLATIGARVVTIQGLLVEHMETKGFLETLSWLFQSGRGATRQLYRYRRLRRPDAAFGGWLLAAAAATAVRRRTRIGAALLPVAYSGAVAALHVARAFRWDRRRAPGLAGAVLLDTLLLNAYFAGRLAGVWVLVVDEARVRG